MRRLNEFFYRLRWGRLEERRRRGLIRLHDLLSRTPFADKYWMIMGLLLGCMRDGGPIPGIATRTSVSWTATCLQFLSAMRNASRRGL